MTKSLERFVAQFESVDVEAAAESPIESERPWCILRTVGSVGGFGHVGRLYGHFVQLYAYTPERIALPYNHPYPPSDRHLASLPALLALLHHPLRF